MSTTKNLLVGIFDDDHTLIHAVEHIRHDGYKIGEVFTPFPVHGLEHALDLRPTKLHTAGFMFGATGTTFALSFITWISTINYPVNIGGKPFFSLPAWIPITFEMTVLFAAWGMTLSFYYLCKLWPGKVNKIVDPRTTDHLFAMTFDLDGKDEAYIDKVSGLLKSNGAIEIYKKEL
ncbi:MAG: DUF3341 domain-containing protein [Bacteroidetes bacterium]|jgi:hypothetical protein|nr:DUF3341 domain-containing protein [Bacteroidota bacterium]MBP7255740.1 DUF3341 domain-containing protein [Chitinophagales bacterium]MBK7139054.1 DUF3341 domain-containing protein [Bacteroidota bacterium]MBK7505748.1 DUF3341 domain-containing protein [Bacteroidota bacterium]MBK7639714.1 DUF3341 domain-containing protein [Bacteroidota bacterium]